MASARCRAFPMRISPISAAITTWNPLFCCTSERSRSEKISSRVVEAFERLNPQFRLVLAGSAGYGAEEIMERISSSRARERIHVHGYVDDLLLARLYRTAAALVFPSLEEGFGFPVVEAMSASLPVVTSNRSSLPEVAGGAARLVDPESTDEIEAGIEDVIVNQDLRQRLIRLGKARATEFNWMKAAHETLGVYAQLQ